MSILVDRDTRLVVQGITGREGAFHAGQMQAYGTNVVAGVTPGKGGLTALDALNMTVRQGAAQWAAEGVQGCQRFVVASCRDPVGRRRSI